MDRKSTFSILPIRLHKNWPYNKKKVAPRWDTKLYSSRISIQLRNMRGTYSITFFVKTGPLFEPQSRFVGKLLEFRVKSSPRREHGFFFAFYDTPYHTNIKITGNLNAVQGFLLQAPVLVLPSLAKTCTNNAPQVGTRKG